MLVNDFTSFQVFIYLAQGIDISQYIPAAGFIQAVLVGWHQAFHFSIGDDVKPIIGADCANQGRASNRRQCNRQLAGTDPISCTCYPMAVLALFHINGSPL